MVLVERSEKDKKYRDNLDIARDMLSIATVKVRKTRIMYQANLSYRLLDKYLKGLLANGLVECDGDSCYLVTARGKEFLQMFEELISRRKWIREEIEGAHKDRLHLEGMCFNNERRNSKERLGKLVESSQVIV